METEKPRGKDNSGLEAESKTAIDADISSSTQTSFEDTVRTVSSFQRSFGFSDEGGRSGGSEI